MLKEYVYMYATNQLNKKIYKTRHGANHLTLTFFNARSLQEHNTKHHADIASFTSLSLAGS